MGFDLFAGDIGNDEVGVLQRHVAIDTIFADLSNEFCESPPSFHCDTANIFRSRWRVARSGAWTSWQVVQVIFRRGEPRLVRNETWLP